MTEAYRDLSDYGIIGNLVTCALISRTGSIDWLCAPHLESGSTFAAILDADKGGRFHVAPTRHTGSWAQYIDETNVLVTTFATPGGPCHLTDFMPVPGEDGSRVPLLVRRLVGEGREVEITVLFAPAFDYARSPARLSETSAGLLAETSDAGQRLRLWTSLPLTWVLRSGEATATFVLHAGQEIWFALGEEDQDIRALRTLLDETLAYWKAWAQECRASVSAFAGPWQPAVVRSGLVLKLLAHAETGAIAAAPTTSLPEVIGGSRNWDYRYAWVRDAAFIVQAFHLLGHSEEGRAHFAWLRRVCHQDPSHMQIMYGLHGESDLTETELPHLAGYRGSRPVRVGNAAWRQTQLDIYGELLNAFYVICPKYGETIEPEDWQFLQRVVDHVCAVWERPDAGIWEMRSAPRHFVYSKLMCWLAVDRGLRIAEAWGFDAPFPRWGAARSAIRRAILEQGFDPDENTFVQAFGRRELDATGLLIPAVGFLPYDDRRVQGTIEAIRRRLTDDRGLVRRYEGEDGLSGDEGAFLLSSFWLVTALAESGRALEAGMLLERLLAYASPLGLYAEEIDPQSGEQLGNFPQAFSHVGLIESVLAVTRALAAAEQEGTG